MSFRKNYAYFRQTNMIGEGKMQGFHVPAIRNKTKNNRSRAFGLDNMRGFLMICVVFGHLLEICPDFPNRDLVYRVIYSFHMPAFIFLVGYFGKFDAAQILQGSILPYFLFQTLYLLFANHVLQVSLYYQYTTPYWLLWFLLVCIFYKLLIPFIDTQSKKKQAVYLALSVVVALIAGYDKTVGYYLSLSRFLVFLPWFILGYYCKKHEKALNALWNRYRWLIVTACLAVIGLSVVFFTLCQFPKDVLYGSYAYEILGYSPMIRAALMITALGWVALLLCVFTGPLGRKIPLLSALGRNTMPVFLLHGFVVRLVAYEYPMLLRTPLAIIWIGGGILLVFGNVFVGGLFRFLFSSFKRK